MTIERREELLTKPHWDYNDIAEYLECGSTKAIQIKNQALREFGGSIRYLTHYVTIDSVLKCVGTTRDREIEVLNQIKNQNKESEV